MNYEWLNDDSRQFLAGGYLSEGETAESRIKDIADNAETILKRMWGEGISDHPSGDTKNKDTLSLAPEIINNFSEKFQHYMSLGYYSLSSPVWANFGKERALPVSCFSTHVSDSCDSIIRANAEVSKMTQTGGGTSGYFGELRGRGAPISSGGESEGAVSFMELFQTTTSIMKQGATRRGSFAAYLDADHPDIDEFLEIRNDGSELQSIFTGVCISDEFMEGVLAKKPKNVATFRKIQQSRRRVGTPYLFFTDNANKNKPQVYKDKDYHINGSNLCSEIFLPKSEEESFVCVLSSMNLLHYDEWKDTDAVETLLIFLDAVNEEFIDKASKLPSTMERPTRFAKRHRALGLGVLGWHSYLQANMIPFGDLNATMKTSEIFKLLNAKTLKASQDMAIWFGEPEVLKGYGLRNTTRLAVAPTKSSSFILGQVSQSIEPIHSNYFIDDKAKIEVIYKNPTLIKLFDIKGKNTKEVWDSIMNKNGSVQHLDFLTDHEKAVFKSFIEISQLDIIKQALVRQPEICQGQSVNLAFHPDTPQKEENRLVLEYWRGGGKSLYYRRSMSSAVKFSQDLMECTACGA